MPVGSLVALLFHLLTACLDTAPSLEAPHEAIESLRSGEWAVG